MLSKKYEYFILIILGIILSYQLFVKPIVGMSDNGDFERMMCQAGIYYDGTMSYDDKYWKHINEQFVLSTEKPREWCYTLISSHSLIIEFSKVLNRILSKDGRFFDIKMIGLANVLLFLSGIAMVLFSCRMLLFYRRYLIVIACLIILMFSDVYYIASFNSFYSHSASLVCFVLVLGLALLSMTIIEKQKYCSTIKKFLIVILFYLTSFGFAISKMQDILCIIPLVFWGNVITHFLFFSRYYFHRKLKNYIFSFLPSLVVFLFLLLILFINGNDKVLPNRGGVYNVVFNRILLQSESIRDDLVALGFNETFIQKYQHLVGTIWCSSNAPFFESDFQKDFFSHVNRMKIIKFYLLRPKRLLNVCRLTSSVLFIRAGYGEFTKSSGLPAFAKSQSFALWSNFREQFFPKKLKFWVIFFGFNFIALIIKYYQFDTTLSAKLLSGLHLVIIIVACFQFLTITFGDGAPIGSFENGTARQFFMFNGLFDICLIFFICYCIGGMFFIINSFNLLRTHDRSIFYGTR